MSHPRFDVPPESAGWVERLLEAMHADVQEALRTLKGHNGTPGLTTTVSHNTRSCEEMAEKIRRLREDVADVRAQLSVKMFPQPDEPATLKARAEATAIRLGSAGGIIMVLLEVFQKLTGG